MWLECKVCGKNRVIKFVDARPNTLLGPAEDGTTKKIIREGIESEAAIEAQKEFIAAVNQLGY